MFKMKRNAVQFYLNENLWSHLNNYEDYRKWEIVYNKWNKQNKNYEYLKFIRKKYAYRQESAGNIQVHAYTHTQLLKNLNLGFWVIYFQRFFFNLTILFKWQVVYEYIYDKIN